MIKSIEFKIFSPEMIKKMSVVEITRPELYDNDGFPIENGVMDPKLGVIDPGMRCRTCGNTVGDCLGHFGHIELVKPITHVLYIKTIYKLLKITCRECGRLLSKEKKPVKKCRHCGAEQGDIKLEKPTTIIENKKVLNQIKIRERLEKIPDEDLEEIGFRGGRPEWLILTVFPVPPVTMRPSITLETGNRSEDDLTHKLVDIVRINQLLKENIMIGAPDFIIDDLWELLQYHVSTFFDNEITGVPHASHRSGRPLRTLAQRLKTKDGRFRQNLTGKRVNFSSRTVISPDCNISINEVGVPLVVAKVVTVPVVVNKNNIEYLRKLVSNGETWPGASYVIRPDGRKKKITSENASEIASEIDVGYVVERHLQDGDIVLFNRQPSLHRMSIMAHHARITPWRTFTLNLSVCAPYNADFDGDEMNLHVLQTEEARAEAIMLMEVQRHIRSPRFGGPIIGCSQDHISGTYMLTRKTTKLSREEVFQIMSEIGADVEVPDKKTFTGKEVFSLILPKGLNMEFKAKACRGCRACKKTSCEYDAYVSIKNGQLKTGLIDKKAIGGEHGKIIDVIEKTYGTEVVHRFIDKVGLLGIKYLLKTGFTFGLDDIDISEHSVNEIKEKVNELKKDVSVVISDAEKGKVELIPGRNARESVETHIMRILSKSMDAAESVISKELVENCAVVMARSGARGGIAHLVQMAGLVGQEKVLGERIHRGYFNRTLSHFRQDELSPEAHGFVTNSYKSGLNVFEFFFNSMSGRENLMDKSLKTKHSGYLERRLMNALQDLRVEYDMTVRDNRGVIIQFKPGEDGIDPAKSEWGMLDVRTIIQNMMNKQ